MCIRDRSVSNDAPVQSSIEASALAYTENDGSQVVTSSLTLNDFDDINLESATISISGNYQAGEDTLAFTDTASIAGIWNEATGELTLTGSDTLEAYQAALRSVTYANNSDNPDTSTRTIDFVVNDGDLSSTVQSRDVDIIAVNDVPEQSAIEGTVLSYTENDGAAALTASIALADLDDTNLEGAVITIGSGYQPGEDRLVFADTATITGVWNASTGQLTLSGTDSVAAYQAALLSLIHISEPTRPY